MERYQHSDDPQQLDLLRVCRIGRAQGLKGEVTVRLYTDEPEYRFEPGSVLYTHDGARRFVVERSRTFKNRWIVKLEGVDDRDASEALNGVELYGEADDPDEMLDEDAWYPRDLVGLQARMADGNELGAPDGMVIGKVVDVIDGPQNLLKIRLDADYRARLRGDACDAGDAGDAVDIQQPASRDDSVMSDSGSAVESAEVLESVESSQTVPTMESTETVESKESRETADSEPEETSTDESELPRTVLVPFVDPLVPDIDLDGGYLTLDPPGGLIPGLG